MDIYFICDRCGEKVKKWFTKSGKLCYARYCNKCIGVRQKVLKLRQEHPYMRASEISRGCGVTRERVGQILKEEGLPIKVVRVHHSCPDCGRLIKGARPLFCNYLCLHNYTHTLIPCNNCGRLKEYNIKQLQNNIEHNKHGPDLFFCSKRCQGKWLAEHYGFVRFPEHRRHRARKWDWAEVYALRDRIGWGGVRIGRALGIPAVTVNSILRKQQKEATKGSNKRETFI